MVKKLFPVLVALLLSTVSRAASEGDDRPFIQREGVLKSLEEHASEWKKEISSKSPKLFFSDKEWVQVQKAVDNATTGAVAIWKKDFFDQADYLVRQPLPAYESPEERTGKHHDAKTLFYAQQELWERTVGDDIFLMSVAARLRGEPRYLSKLHDMVMNAISFKTWGQNANPKMGHNSDLAAGHVSRGVALAYDWHPNIFTNEEKQQIRKVVSERMPSILKGLYGDAFWARQYDLNHNHVSVTGLAFCGVAFYNEIPEAPEWLAAARLNFQNTMKYSPADGSSLEGVGYWSYALTYILQYIEATRLVIDSEELYKSDCLKNSSSYRLMASTPDLEGTLPWGDTSAKDFCGPHHILALLSQVYGDPNAAWLAQNLPFQPRRDIRAMAVLWGRNLPKNQSAPVLMDSHWLESDLVTTRSGWGAEDYILAIKSGLTNVNHGHLDVGALAFAYGSEWLITTPGYGRADSEREFWDAFGEGKRWRYYSNSTQSHATILVNGKNQKFAKGVRAKVDQFLVSPLWQWTNVDLGEAYEDVSSLKRGVLHSRGRYMLVLDDLSAPQPVKVEWLAQCASEPLTDSNSVLIVGNKGRIRIKAINPELPFVRREPTTPRVDVLKENINPFAATQNGSNVSYHVLLQPTPGDVEESPIQTEVKESKEKNLKTITLSTSEWTDIILKYQTPSPMAAGKKEQDISATALITVLHYSKGTLESVLATRATDLAVNNVLSLKTDHPGEIAAQLVGVFWVIDSNVNLLGKMKAMGGFQLQEAKSNALPKQEGSYRYYLAKSKMSEEMLEKKISELQESRRKSLAASAGGQRYIKLSPTIKIPIEAESFIPSSKAKLEIVERVGASGKAVRGFGGQSLNDIVEWKFKVEKTGLYQLRLRYATGADSSKFIVRVDGGRQVGTGVDEISVATTGGWSKEKDDWKEVMLEGKEPMVFHLSQGEHLLQIKNPTASFNIDRLEFVGTDKF